jgi:hypothetical protein
MLFKKNGSSYNIVKLENGFMTDKYLTKRVSFTDFYEELLKVTLRKGQLKENIPSSIELQYLP